MGPVIGAFLTGLRDGKLLGVIGAGGSGKHDDPTVIPAGNFTLSIMFVNPGQGNAAHTHEVEECFFVLQGFLDVFVEDEKLEEARALLPADG